ncbi:FMN-dependent NADH-azoreductase 1 [Gongronella butleri]|nr:FMN-dependent NADH-azoreductase 1 [Gongronella butleri]
MTKNKTLMIHAHPKVDDPASYSVRVGKRFLKTYEGLVDADHIIEHIYLYRDEVPALDVKVFSAWDKQEKGTELSKSERQVMDRMSEIMAQFKSAHTFVIVMPLHNFSVPSKLKDYMDNIIISDHTFKYTSNGYVGLMTGNRRVLVIQASGAVLTNNDWFTSVEFSHQFLKASFEFMGILDYQIIRVQGTDTSKVADPLTPVLHEADEAAKRLTMPW